MHNLLKPLLVAVLLMGCVAEAFAQKQPDVQQAAVHAPESIKIDGALKEWDNKFLTAYNPGSRIYYVVSNDDNNLYLTVRGLGTRATTKILGGGLTFTISHATDRKLRDKDPGKVSVTYPMAHALENWTKVLRYVYRIQPLVKDSVNTRKQIDSLQSLANAQLFDMVKEIKVSGIKSIADSVISVYNTDGIKAASRVLKLQPIVEIAIPLKYLGLTAGTRFSYNIRLNGIPEDPDIGELIDFKTGAADPDEEYMTNRTEFWGEYILAKKP